MAPRDDITAIVRDALIAALKDREQELKDIAKEAGSAPGHDPLGDIGSLATLIVHFLEAGALLGLGPLGALEAVNQVSGSAGKFGEGIAFGYWLGNIAYSAAQPLMLPINHGIANLAQTEIFEPTQAAKLESQAIINNATGRSEAAGNNLAGEHYDKLVEGIRTRPDVIVMMDLLNKGELTRDQVTTALNRLGYSQEWHAPLLALARSFLSPADLALASLRGIIDDQVLNTYSKALGMTEADMQVLIGNTGEPPAVMELLEAYRRGFIDQTRLERGIRQSRVRNEWIDVVEKLRYSPMSIADAVRAVVENYLTSDEGLVIAQQNGLMAEHWPIMVQAWGRPLSHEQMMTLYHRGQATLDEVKQALRESDIKNKYVDQAVELGRTLIPERTLVSMVDHGVISRDDAMRSLTERGYNQTDADRLIKLGISQRTTSHRTLSKSDILAMYTDALMNRDKAIQHLEGLGYHLTDAVEMLDLADYKRKSSQLRTVQRGVQASLKAGHITEAQALTQLETAGLDNAQARILVDEWLHEKRIVTRSLTESQIIKAVSDKIITPDDGRSRLLATGLASGDIDILFKIHGIEQYVNAW